MATNTSKSKDTPRETADLMAGMSEQAIKNWEKALRNGIRLQEQASQWWSESFNAATVAQDWQKRMLQFQSMATSMVPQSQRQMESVIDLMAQNSRAASEIYSKAMDAAQTPVSLNGENKWTDLWTSSLEVMRGNSEALLSMNNQALTAWTQFIRTSEAMTQDAMAK